MQKNHIAFLIILFSGISGMLGGIIASHFFGKEIFVSQNGIEVIEERRITKVDTLENTVTQLAQKVSPSVVSIIIKKDLPLFQENPFGFFRVNVGSIETEVGGGTGFFVDPKGTIITNKHVVKDPDASYSVVLNNGQTYDAQILALDPVNDLAVLKIEYESIPMKLSTKSDSLNIGQFVIAVGNALSEFQNSVSFGVVSGKNRIIEASGQRLSSLIQTDTAINPGNSGGPLIDMSGKVIGINTAIAGGQGLGFSISLTSEKVAYMLESIEKYGEIKKPFIGIYYIPLNSSIAKELGVSYDYGIYIPDEEGAILKGTAADDAGLKTGDIILSVDGQKISGDFTLDIILQNSFPGEIIQLELLRDTEIQEISLELGKL